MTDALLIEALEAQRKPEATSFDHPSDAAISGYNDAICDAIEIIRNHPAPVVDEGAVERVAKAICSVYYDKNERDNSQCKSEYVHYIWDKFILEAKAAIAALTERKG